jgi:hypothetical protein
VPARGALLPGQAWLIVTAKHSATAPKHILFINGHSAFAEQYSGTLSLTGELEIGRYSKPGYANHYLDGEITEILVYNRPVTENERVEIESYLKIKYGLHDAPVTDAGPDKICVEGVGVLLDGTASDDGIPGPLSYVWSKVFGPGEVTFADSASAQTEAIFSAPGCYILRFTANDGELESFDEIEVAVAVAGATNVPSAGLRLWLKADETMLAHGNPVLTWQDRSGLDNDLSQTQTGLAPVFTTNTAGGFHAITFDGTDDRLSGTFGAVSGDISIIVVHQFEKLHQPVDDFDYLINLGVAEPWQQLSVSRSAYDAGREDAYYARLGPDPDAGSFFGPVLPGQRWQTVTAIHSTTGTRHRVWLDGIEKETQQYTATLTLNGDVELGCFSKPDYENHYLDGSVSEVLVYDCALDDASRQAIEDYLKAKYTLNAAPQVDAGNDIEILEGEQALLSGSITDDGFPVSPGVVTSLWTCISGPGTVAFSNANMLGTSAVFERDGLYVLSLSAWDGEAISSDEMTVFVSLAESAQVPLAGLELWLTADCLPLSDGDGVQSWLSRLGGTTLSQASPQSSPVFNTNGLAGRAVVSFDGSDDFLSGQMAAVTGEVTIVSVCRFGSLHQPQSDSDFLLNLGNADPWNQVSVSRCAAGYATGWDDVYYSRLGADPAGSYSGPVLPGQQWITVSAVHSASGTRHRIWLDALEQTAEQYTGSLELNGTVELGRFSKPGYANHYLTGDIAEVLIYNRALSLDELAALQGYLVARYDVSEGDIDGDSLSDAWELLYFGTLSFGPDDDTDGDGLSNLAEFQLGTNPSEADTDGDGMADGDEVALGKDPKTNNPFNSLPFMERFEDDTVTVGDLHGQNNWDVNTISGGIAPVNSAVVQTNIVFDGLRSLEVNSSDEHVEVSQTFADPNSDMVWLDFQYMAIASKIPTNDPVAGAMFCFNNDLNLVVCDGLQPEETRWVTFTNHVPVETMIGLKARNNLA